MSEAWINFIKEKDLAKVTTRLLLTAAAFRIPNISISVWSRERQSSLLGNRNYEHHFHHRQPEKGGLFG